MTNEQLAILLARYAAMLNDAMGKLDSCGENAAGYKELHRLYMVLRDDYELLDGTATRQLRIINDMADRQRREFEQTRKER